MAKFRTGNRINLRQILQKEEIFVAPEESDETQGTEKEPFEPEEQSSLSETGEPFEEEDQAGEESVGNRGNLYQVVETELKNPNEAIRFEVRGGQNSPGLARTLDANEDAQDTDFNLISALGTPLVMPVMIEGYQLPNEPVVTITGSKKIIRTALTGVNREEEVQRRGTVKELISVNDYQIKITGRIVDEDDPGRYPERIVTKIRNLFELRRALTINCKITDMLGITHIAVEKLSFPGDSGMENSQRYEISGFSDEDFRTDLISQEVS
ncbi:MAG: hypothetical protein Roseis2KO_27570 [Roseivirga sp.]